MSELNYLLPQQRNKSRGSETYYGGICENGRVRWASLKTKSHKVAMEWYNKSQAGRYAPKEEQPSRLRICEAMEAYLAEIEKVRRRTAGSVKQYKIHLLSFRAYCAGKGIADIGEITALACSNYAQAELAKLSRNTATARMIVLRSFFSWVIQSHDIAIRNPFRGIAISKPKPEPRKFWTVEECEKIMEAADDAECKCWFALMAWAGLRKEEARFLKMENLEGGKISLIGKGGKAATLPISTRLKECLNKYLIFRGDEPGPLFPRLATMSRNIERLIRLAAAKAKVSNADTAHYHRFRHSFASNLLRMGRSIKAVQMLMRHEDVTLTLKTYSHLLPSDLEKEVEI